MKALKIRSIISDIERGFGWITIQQLIEQWRNEFSAKEFDHMVETLADNRMLTDENLLEDMNSEGLSPDKIAYITYKTYLKHFRGKPADNNKKFMKACNRLFKIGHKSSYGTIVGKRITGLKTLEVAFGNGTTTEFELDEWNNLIEIKISRI